MTYTRLFLWTVALGVGAVYFLGASAQVPMPSPSVAPVTAPDSSGLIAWIQMNGALLFAVLFGVSEAIALIPAFKSNSLFQLIYSVLKTLARKN